MSVEEYGDVGQDIIRFHRIITRSLEVAILNIDKYIEEETLSISEGEGFLKYMQSFSSVLNAHHILENEKIFPYFKDKLPDAPYERLMAQHKEVEKSLSEINNGINSLNSKANDLESLKLLKSGLKKIDKLWHPHIRIEEKQIYGKVKNLNISFKETERLRAEYAQFFEEHTNPPYLVIPFVLYNLSPEDREALAQGLPKIVTKQLVPVDWKDKWISMQPFLLK